MRLPLRISIGILIIGVALKIQHWPYATETMVVAFTGIALFYPIRFWKKEQKLFLDYIKLGLVIFWCLNGVLTVMHLPKHILFEIITSALFLVWLVMEGFSFFNPKEESGESNKGISLSSILFASAASLIVIGALFKIMHWPGASIMLILGLGLGLAWVIKGSME